MAQYVAVGYVAPGYYQTGLSINWLTKVIFVPKFFLTFVSGTTYQLDTNLFRLALRDLEDDEAGISFPPTHNHNTQVVLSGVTYARVIEMINGYTVTFEDGLYSVNLIGSNNNIPDVLNLNQVSVRASNSAGLQQVTSGSGVTAQDKIDIAAATLASVVDGTVTLAESIRLQNTVLAGKVSGAGTGTETFRDLADTKNRIVATVDPSGNRTTITRDAT